MHAGWYARMRRGACKWVGARVGRPVRASAGRNIAHLEASEPVVTAAAEGGVGKKTIKCPAASTPQTEPLPQTLPPNTAVHLYKIKLGIWKNVFVQMRCQSLEVQCE